jgi:hypothetical protein
VPTKGYGFDCTVPVQAGTTVLLVGGDSTGVGSGGSETIVVRQSGDQSCLNSLSPSSTPGPPAGASPTSSSSVYPTSSSGGYPTSSIGGYPTNSSGGYPMSSSGVGDNNDVNGGNGGSR